ncbi:ROK family protein [Nonomuraea sp. NPDC049646]|uniref:ROK family protein n=1 Tax=unclassified Nonomuraea TaxID=2593643 RepID=UPI0037A76D9B
MTVPALDLGGTKFAAAAVSSGPLDPAAGTVSPVNIPSWRDFPLVKTVEERLPERAARLAGDAQCMALGEWWRGGSGTARAMLGLVVSTGVGGGIVLDGLPYTGPTGNAGHIGHLAADPEGPPCPCGATGCVELYASGPNMAAWARDQGWDGPDAKHLAAGAAAGDVIATRAFERAARALAIGILSSAVLLDLDHVVIGGRGRRRAGSVRPAQAGGEGERRIRLPPPPAGGAHAPGPRRRTARGRRSRPEPAKEHTMKPAAPTAGNWQTDAGTVTPASEHATDGTRSPRGGDGKF